MITRCLAKCCLADCTEFMGGNGWLLCFCSLNYKNSGYFCSLKYKVYFCTVVQIQGYYGKL